MWLPSWWLGFCFLIVGVFLLITAAVARGDSGGSNLSNPIELLEALDWVQNSKDCRCGGYYRTEQQIDFPRERDSTSAPVPIKITSAAPALFSQTGVGELSNGVTIEQASAERKITADSIQLLRNMETGNLEQITLQNRVKITEADRLLSAHQGKLDLIKRRYNLAHAVYRVPLNRSTTLMHAWGQAKKLTCDQATTLTGNRITYSCCPPDRTVWHLYSSQLSLDDYTKRGRAKNSVFFIKNIPVFYLPYLSFPLDNQRKSGLLLPSPTYSSQSGFGLALPCYFNLAPNHDLTITPKLLTKRGLLLNSKWRYLTRHSVGSLYLDYIHRDNAFAKFRQATLLSSVATELDPADLKLLQASKNRRAWLTWQNRAVFNSHWTTNLAVNYTTDDYFPQNFFTGNQTADMDQLLNRLDLSYAGRQWNFLGRIQYFQTLHPITYSKTQDQYTLLPQLKLSGSFPLYQEKWGYQLTGELTNFLHNRSHADQERFQIDGLRLSLAQSLNYQLIGSNGKLIPKLELKGIGYSIYDQDFLPNKPLITSTFKLYPILSLESYQCWQRDFKWKDNHFQQTLEPRLFYLWVPRIKQDELPVFDSYLPAFSLNQLFRNNRFLGGDRVGDANQVALTVTTRLFNEQGRELVSAGLGQLFAFKKHQLALDPQWSALGHGLNSDPLQNKHYSPIVGQLTYHAPGRISGNFDFAWNIEHRQIDSTSFKLQYKRDAKHLLGLWYNRTPKVEQALPGQLIALNRLGIACYWQIRENWNLLGSTDYNLGHNQTQDYFVGIEYNSCCWGMRIAYSRNFIGMSSDYRKSFDAKYYVQVIFKGFSDVSLGSMDSFLAKHFDGFGDNFLKR